MAVVKILISVILAILTVASFLPQYHRILARKSCDNISLLYIFCNLIAATEQFGLFLYLFVYDGMISSLPTVGDCLDLIQFLIVLAGHLGLFILRLRLPPEAGPSRNRLAIGIYASFFLISVVAGVVAAVVPRSSAGGGFMDPHHFGAAYADAHQYYITPAVTLVAMAAWIPQVREMRSSYSRGHGSLSVAGLVRQLAVFSFVAIAWLPRFTVPVSYWMLLPLPWALRRWYCEVGWAAVDNAAFAAVQAVVLAYAHWQQRNVVSAYEVEPLLA